MKKKIKKRQNPRHFLWITDPWESLDHPRDTTLRLAEEAMHLGFRNFWCDFRTIRWSEERVILDAHEITKIPLGRKKEGFLLSPLQTLEPSAFEQIHYRTDPPVDLHYLQPLQLLKLCQKSVSKIVNPPDILLGCNEKLQAGTMKELTPPMLASSQWEKLAPFGKSFRKTVLKPLHEAQSHGVELLDWTTSARVKRAHQLLRAATHQFTHPVLLQKYLPGISHGETRLWFLDGKLLACARKLPLTGDFRVNIDQGSRLAPAQLTSQEKRAARKIGSHLQNLAIRLAAVDLIDGYVTDFNFTSPGLIVQMEKILEKNLAKTIIERLL